MKSSRLVLSVAALLLACSDGPGVGSTGLETPPPPVRSWTVTGTVRDENGHEVAGAVVEIVEGLFKGRSSVSSGDGSFAFQGVSGPMVLTASMGGYERYVKQLNVAADVSLAVKLFKYIEADSIQLGATIRATVAEYASPCDAIRWDAKSPCKRFIFRPQRTGTLTVLVSWSGGPELDATMVTLEGEYVATSAQAGREAVLLVGVVEAGRTYEIRVNSYYTAQMFDLLADFQ